MDNKQIIHDLTMLQVKVYYDFVQPDENNNIQIDVLAKYYEFYPKIEKQYIKLFRDFTEL